MDVQSENVRGDIMGSSLCSLPITKIRIQKDES